MISILFALTTAHAQDLALPAPSPTAEVMQTVGVVEVTVNYSSPGKKERTIWGELVPYDKLWRTGANSATTFETTGDLKVGGQEVPAGKYAVFTIPGKDEWTVILNTNPNQGGTRSYDEKLNQASFKVKPVEGEARERLTFLFTDTKPDSTRLDLVWDGVRVEIPIEVDTNGLVDAGVESFVSGAGSKLARAARHYASQETPNLDEALRLIDLSLGIEKGWFNTWIKADILHKKGDNKDAYKLAQEAMKLGEPAGDGFFYKGTVEKALKDWPKK